MRMEVGIGRLGGGESVPGELLPSVCSLSLVCLARLANRKAAETNTRQ